MQTIDKLTMFSIAVSDMPKAKAFYADNLGLPIEKDYRIDDNHWWVTLALPNDGVSITLARYGEPIKPGTLSLYFATADIAAANKELRDQGVKVNDVKDDLYGPGSGVKWFNLEDPDGNLVHLVQA